MPNIYTPQELRVMAAMQPSLALADKPLQTFEERVAATMGDIHYIVAAAGNRLTPVPHRRRIAMPQPGQVPKPPAGMY